MPCRPLGRTGHDATLFALGGEGVLRTVGRGRAAAAVIHRALDLGVNYCDTAPAYAGSNDYYGASKTHDRTRDGSLRLLDEGLKRLRTDHLDLWQLHDLRTPDDLRRIFAKGGAMEALLQAREDGRVRFLGITGHQDPAILLDAMGRFDFDTVLMALNAADIHRLSFAQSVLVDAARRGMGVIGMKVYAAGVLVRAGLPAADAMRYVLGLPGVSTVVIGCSTPEEVEENARIACEFQPFDESERLRLEARTQAHADHFTSYKRPD
jgi:predicted aldo/keto reductase-like oxidoreductase